MFEDINVIIRNCKSKKDEQYNGQKKKKDITEYKYLAIKPY
jgi:hypothetical protein